jgi:hypothetical protein
MRWRRIARKTILKRKDYLRERERERERGATQDLEMLKNLSSLYSPYCLKNNSIRKPYRVKGFFF